MSRFVNVSADELASHPVTRCPTRRARGIPKATSVQTRFKSHVARVHPGSLRRALVTTPIVCAPATLRKTAIIFHFPTYPIVRIDFTAAARLIMLCNIAESVARRYRLAA